MPTTQNFLVKEFKVSGHVNAYPMDFFLGDLNRDGKLDLFVTHFYYPMKNVAIPTTVLIGNGKGVFSQASDAFVSGGIPDNVWGRQIVAADFNGDGQVDIFVADHGFDADPFPGAQNSLLLSTGNGRYINSTASLPQLTDFSHSAAAADIDRDGDIDIYVNNYNGFIGWAGNTTNAEAHYLLINDGAGHFSVSRKLPADMVDGFYNSPATLFLDHDGDGDQDLLLAPNATDQQDVRILLNDGFGDLSKAETSFRIAPVGASDGVVDVVGQDLDADGLKDLIFSIAVNNYASGRIAIFMNHGNGSYLDETATRVDKPATATWILRNKVIDLNGDGYLDFVQTLSGNGDVAPVLLNDGSGHFIRLPLNKAADGRSDSFTGGYGTSQVLAGDFNRDGRVDLMTYGYGGNGTDIATVHIRRDPGPSQIGTKSADALVGDSSSETLSGMDGNDVIFGGRGADTLTGGRGADKLIAGAGRDRLLGDAGVDRLAGGAGRDVLSGGASRDVFDFNAIGDSGKKASSRDIIMDFKHGVDDIDISSIDASALGNQAFNFIGRAAFTGVEGQLRWVRQDLAGTANDKTIIEGDINGDGRADFAIEVAGLKPLAVGDFIL